MTNTQSHTEAQIFLYLFTLHYLTNDGYGFMHVQLPFSAPIDCVEDIEEVQQDQRKLGYRAAFVLSYNLLRTMPASDWQRS